MKPSPVDQLVRGLDPVTEEDINTWLASSEAVAVRTRVLAGADPSMLVSAPISRWRRARTVALVTAIVLVAAAGAGAARMLLGGPAPSAVKRDLQGVDAGFPPDLRYNPGIARARLVATTGTSRLYAADLKDGGECAEIVTAGTARGAVCQTADQRESQPFQVTIPFTDPITQDSPVTIGGRVNDPRISSVEIHYGDGSSDAIVLGADGFFLFDVPSDHLTSVHTSDFRIIGLNADGAQVAQAEIPAIEEEPAGPVEDTAPITVDTISDASDFTQVLGVRGRVNAKGAASLEFRYPQGDTVTVPLRANGSYSFDIPAERQGDLFRAPGTLIARDAHEREVASAPVAAVAYWRANGGPSSG